MKRWSPVSISGILFFGCLLVVSPSKGQEQEAAERPSSDAAPVIDREVFNSQLRLDPVEIEAAPYQRINNVVLSQVGVNKAHQASDEIRFRGTGIDGTDSIVDGVSQGNSYSNVPDYSINLDAIENIEIETSGFTAEYGNVRSGVINIRTKGDDGPPALLNISDDELTHVARAFVSVLELREALETQTISAEEFQEKTIQSIESEGVSLRRYAEVLETAQNNSKLQKRLLERARAVVGQ